jgi:hypothetical protein
MTIDVSSKYRQKAKMLFTGAKSLGILYLQMAFSPFIGTEI